MTNINRYLAPLSESYNSSFLDELWLSIEEVVHLSECEIYSYVPNMEDDPFSQGNLWTFNYFFFNRGLKRIIYFTCIARSKLMPGSPLAAEYSASEPEDDEADDEFMGEMEEEPYD